MSWWSEARVRLGSVLRRRDAEAELDEELRLHVELETAANVRAGMAPEEAHRAALRRLGGVERVKEEVRDERGTRPLEDFVSDLRFAARSLTRSPGFAIAVVLTLALGIGANTAIFSVLNAVVFRPLEFPGSERLVQVCEEHESVAGFCTTSFVNVRSFRQLSHTMEHLGAGRGWSFILRGTEGAESVRGALADPDLFSVFGVTPALGRSFLPEDAGPGATSVALLAHESWRSRYGSDPDIVGRSITIDDGPVTVVGVLPAGLSIPELEEIEIWRPIPFDGADPQVRGWRGFRAYGLLRPGVTLEAGVADLESAARVLEERFPDTSAGWGVRAHSLHDVVVGEAKRPLQIFMGAVGFVLLIGCVNVANLLLARSERRRREFAVRRSLGADAGRLARLLLAEGTLLAGIGAAFGLALAAWMVGAFVALAPADIPRVSEVRVDGAAVLFTVAVGAVATLLFGLLPALQAVRPDLVTSLRSGSERGATTRLGGRAVLVTVEVAIGLVLLTGAGLLGRAFLAVSAWEPGLERDRILTFWSLASDGRYESGREVVRSLREITDEIASLPSVARVGTASAGPLFGGRETIAFRVLGSEQRTGGELPVARWYDMDPGYFATLGIPLLEGRYFRESDDGEAPAVAIVNRTLAERYLPADGAIGSRIELEERGTVSVIGVVGDVRPFRPDEAPEPEIYWPLAQQPRYATYFVLRTSDDPAGLEGVVRARVAAVAPDVSASRFRTLDELVGGRLVSPRFHVVVLTIFAGIALVLAAVGVFGVISYNVSGRTREIGLRKALGADRRRIAAQIVRQGLTPAAFGLLIGVGGAVAVTRLMEGMLYGVAATDPLTLALVTALLAAVAAAACWIPARRASSLEPMDAMRVE